MKNIREFILEATKYAKEKNINIAKKLYCKGKNFNNISCFAILTSQNPDSKEVSSKDNKKLLSELKNELKRNQLVFIPIKGHYGGNSENSYLIFNIKLDTAKYLAGKFEQTSFFYSYPDNEGNLISEYWEKKDTNAPYDKSTNDYKFINKTVSWENKDNAKDNYTIIGKDFKYSIDPEVFEPIDNKISENLEKINEDNDIVLEWAYNRVGQKASYYRSKIYEGLLEE